MHRYFFALLVVAACGSSSSSPPATVDGPPGHDADAPMTVDGPPHVTTYAQSTIAPSCDAPASSTTLPLLDFVHATDITNLARSISFFDATRTRISVAEQGYVMLFDAGSANITTLVDPVQIPSASEPNGLVAPLWEFHLSAVFERSTIELSSTGDHQTIAWNDFAIGMVSADQTSHITMQVKLFDDGAIELHYCTLDPGGTTTGDDTGARGTVGIESPDGTHGVSVGFDQAVASTTAAYRFTPE